jgi:hypothetical protein
LASDVRGQLQELRRWPLWPKRGDAVTANAKDVNAIPDAFAALGAQAQAAAPLPRLYHRLGISAHVLSRPGGVNVQHERSAAALGLTVPLPLLGLADEVIE